MKTIYLIGYMGSGKTTLGQAVARRCGLRFVDLDDYIEVRRGCSVRDIFAAGGEEAFRAAEREALDEVSRQGVADIVACGGGTPCFGDNMDRMNARGVTVHLTVPHERLLARLKDGRAKRPLIASLDDAELDEFISRQMERRMPYYSRAAVTFDSSRLESPEEIDVSVDRFLNLIGHED